jgi:hypothetical protein
MIMIETKTTNKEELAIKMVLDAWRSKVSQFDKLLSELSDEQLLKEVAPGKNRGIYLLGHLTALADSIVPLLGYGEKHAPHLFKPFVQTPDKENRVLPAVNEMRQDWNKVKTLLDKQITNTAPDEWFKKHTSISEEDFAKEPHRNKLNVVLSRIGHMDYHIGQLVFLKDK